MRTMMALMANVIGSEMLSRSCSQAQPSVLKTSNKCRAGTAAESAFYTHPFLLDSSPPCPLLQTMGMLLTCWFNAVNDMLDSCTLFKFTETELLPIKMLFR